MSTSTKKTVTRFRCAKCGAMQRVTTTTKTTRPSKSDVTKALEAAGAAAPVVAKVLRELFS